MEAYILQLVFIIPLTILVGWCSRLSARIDTMQKEYYDKAETKEQINLNLKPIQVEIQHTHDDVKDIKNMLTQMVKGNDKDAANS